MGLFGPKIRKAGELIGESPDRLTLPEARAYAGKWVALERYTPETLPLRRIAALGDSTRACIEQLAGQGLDPERYEYVAIQPEI